ncbi:acyltransferase family protein [Zafaria sp. Z1313]|uniref:acyltransferase family protein n=1 Tax=unclassified Zafaria TaxID=2828765 RepID=UPI002E79DC87|nr:acyltransferase family protein [Zafaria sp. J156]MEE1620464.1 acyltransferase family protein [Zafaria sp. J156]
MAIGHQERLRTREPNTGAATVAKPAYRPEVQGLRAFAVLMVVVYHVWLGRVSGGVDVFLLISAFLLTVSFTYKVEAGKPLKLLGYWLNRARGLLPAAIVVLLAVLAATVSLLPRTRWEDVAEQTWSSLFYYQNWTLADAAVDYYAANHSTASPLQHFWSLSIQGQVFILWPLILAAAALAWAALRRLRPTLGFRPVLAAAFGAVFAASLAYSVHVTYTNQALAYFDTRARLWEFALGSLLVVVLPWASRLPQAVRVVMGWMGLAAMLACGIVLNVQAVFPGYIALWPTLAAALIISAGATGHRFGVDRLLSAAPLTRLGDISYALYLWHWPILVIYLTVDGRKEAGPLGGTAVIALSLALAWATTRAIETPFHAWRWPTQRRRRLGLVIAVMIGLVAMPLTGWQTRVDAFEQKVQEQTPQDNPGALVLAGDYEEAPDPDAVVLPLPNKMNEQWANFGGDCTGEYALTDPRMEYCQSAGDPATASKTVMVVGDSHAQHWTTALNEIAAQNDWAWILVTRPACRFGAGSGEREAECNDFNAAATQYVLDHRPDAVLTVASLTAHHGNGEEGSVPADNERIVPGYLEGVAPFLDAGIQVVGMRDTPRFTFNVPECVDMKGPDAEACAHGTDELMAPVNPLDELESQVDHGQLPDELSFFDMTDQLCVDGTCAPVIGNVLAYMDESHLTKTFVATTAPVFERRLKEALDW